MQKKSIKITKTLRLIRHAKSSWKHDLQDIERPLKQRGIEDSNSVAAHLYSDSFAPNLIVSSPAKRTVKTAQIFINRLALKSVQFELRTELYDFSGENLIKIIKNTDDSINDLLVFAHNNALTNFVNTFGSIHIENVVTSGYVEISFNENSWSNINKGITERIVFPKDLKANM